MNKDHIVEAVYDARSKLSDDNHKRVREALAVLAMCLCEQPDDTPTPQPVVIELGPEARRELTRAILAAGSMASDQPNYRCDAAGHAKNACAAQSALNREQADGE